MEITTTRGKPILHVIVVFALGLLCIFSLQSLSAHNLILKQGIVWTANVLMMIAAFFLLKKQGKSLKDIGIQLGLPSFNKAGTVFLQSVLVLIVATLAFFIGSTIMVNISGMPETADLSNYAYLKNNFPAFLMTMFGVLIVSSFGEEFIYRGFLITALKDSRISGRYLNLMAILTSAIVFGLAHYQWGLTGVVQTSFMGAALGYFYIRLKSLWPLILAHIYMDVILMTQLYIGLNQS